VESKYSCENKKQPDMLVTLTGRSFIQRRKRIDPETD
jgi:hypothetical protein